jgi:hypothetical protein
MKDSFFIEQGFQKTYPFGYEGEENVCYYELELRGLTLITFRDDEHSDEFDGISIYESDCSLTFTDEESILAFINLLKKQKSWAELLREKEKC